MASEVVVLNDESAIQDLTSYLNSKCGVADGQAARDMADIRSLLEDMLSNAVRVGYERALGRRDLLLANDAGSTEDCCSCESLDVRLFSSSSPSLSNAQTRSSNGGEADDDGIGQLLCRPIKMLLDENESLAYGLKDKIKRIRTLEEQTQFSQTSLLNARTELVTVRDKNVDLREEVSDLRQELCKLATRLCDAMEEMDAAKKREQEVRQAKRDKASKVLQSHSHRLNARLKQEAEQKRALKDTEASTETDARRIRQLRGENLELQNRIVATSQRRSRLEFNLRRSLQVMSALTAEKGKLESSICKLEKEVNALRVGGQKLFPLYGKNSSNSKPVLKLKPQRSQHFLPSANILKYLWHTRAGDGSK